MNELSKNCLLFGLVLCYDVNEQFCKECYVKIVVKNH